LRPALEKALGYFYSLSEVVRMASTALDSSGSIAEEPEFFIYLRSKRLMPFLFLKLTLLFFIFFRKDGGLTYNYLRVRFLWDFD